MKKTKPIISILLILLIISSFITCTLFTASAENTDTSEETTPSPAIARIYITTENGNGVQLQKKDDYVKGSIKIVDTDNNITEGEMQIKVRGNSTAKETINKKAFTIKFGSKTDVLGMGKAKKWTLLANAFDPTLMRNYLAFDMAQTMGLEYTSQQSYVELWLDGSYRGSYILTEPVEVGSTRVDIDIESNDGMKDFLIEREFNRYESDVTYFYADDIRFAVKEPEEPTDDQLNYMKDVMNDIAETIKSGDRQAIESKIDIPSFTRFYILNELFKPVDFDFSSVYFYYKDGMLYCGPAWDYDLSSGNINDTLSETAEKAAKSDLMFANGCHFYKHLCSYDWFNEEITSVYKQYYDYISNITAENGLMDNLLCTYGEVFRNNFELTEFKPTDRWVAEQKVPLRTFEENVDYLREWLYDRNNFLSSYYDVVHLIGDVDNDNEITVLDATTIQFHLANIKPLTEKQLKKADFDNDGEISVMDATSIQRHIARL